MMAKKTPGRGLKHQLKGGVTSRMEPRVEDAQKKRKNRTKKIKEVLLAGMSGPKA